tara:strand:- start:48 stop:341 length:294 start_codon:yes stop_codon:yes gene_type:complete
MFGQTVTPELVTSAQDFIAASIWPIPLLRESKDPQKNEAIALIMIFSYQRALEKIYAKNSNLLIIERYLMIKKSEKRGKAPLFMRMAHPARFERATP